MPNHDGAHTPARTPFAPIRSALAHGFVLRNRQLAARVAELERENRLLREAAEWAMVAGGTEAAYQLGRWDERFGKKEGREAK